MLHLSNLSYAIGLFLINVSEELMVTHPTHAVDSIKENDVWFNNGGSDRLRLGRTSQY